MLHAVVMAGGSGTRFWPMSRQKRPKHLLPLAGPSTLVQQAVGRIVPLVTHARAWVVTAADQCAELQRQLAELPVASILAEPCPRDTAPCIGLAATLISAQDPEATLIVMPADHVIEPDTEFRRGVELAANLVAEDPKRLLTFGIRPDRPATGYGYIHRATRLPGHDAPPVFGVRAFREKPALELAVQYLASGEFYWNSGIFVWKAKTILDELRESRPKLHEAVARIGAAWNSAERRAVFEREYQSIDRVSIDYAVMERARNVLVVEASFRWDDLGSWGAVQRVHQPDAAGNTVLGMHCGLSTRDSIVVTDPDHMVATLGVNNLVIVQSGNATLIADKREEESVRRLVELMRERGLGNYL